MKITNKEIDAIKKIPYSGDFRAAVLASCKLLLPDIYATGSKMRPSGRKPETKTYSPEEACRMVLFALHTITDVKKIREALGE